VLRSGTGSFGGTTVQFAPVDPRTVINSWIAGHITYPSRKTALNSIRKVVPDASITDLHHSIARLLVPEKGASAHTQEHESIMNKSVESLHHTTHSTLRGNSALVKNPQLYTDTRFPEKRHVFLYKKDKAKNKLKDKIKLLMSEGYPQKQAIAIALTKASMSKYSVTKAGSKGLVDQISPLAAFGVWRKPGEFSTSLEYEPAKNKKLVVDQYQPANTKPNAPANPINNIKTQRKLSVEYIRKLSLKLKSYKSKKKV
jgi:hypothetical protein